MTKVQHLVAEIHVNARDGCLHAYSKDIPGFHLCAGSYEDLEHDLPDAIAFLFKVKHNLVVQVQDAPTPKQLAEPKPSKRAPSVRSHVVMTPAFALA